jgi:serine protease Do
MNTRRYLPALAIVAVLGIGILIGTLVQTGARAARGFAGAPDAKVLPPPSPIALSNSFASVATAVEPAVVNINTESTVRVSGRRQIQPPGGPDGDAPYDDFFDHFFHYGPDGSPRDFRQQSLGSGFVLDKSGYVMTNYHVIMREGEDANDEDRPVDRIRVFIHGEDNLKGYLAKIVGFDKSTDLAVIKIEAGRPLPTVEFGDSDSMRVGDWVLAIGSPFGLEATVTAGIVSAKDRRDIERGVEGQFKRFIQTDAAINPGNSGGPLVNLAAQVIGINTAIATRHGTSDGVGFAMPSNTARKVYNAIVTTGSMRRGAIGIQFTSPQNPALLRSFGADHGVVVDRVEHGSPADRAGLHMGDVIVALDGKTIANTDDMVAFISDTEIGKVIKVDFVRDGKTMSANVQVADRDRIVNGEVVSARDDNQEQPHPAAGVFGLSIRNLTRDQSQELSDKLHLTSPQGVLVTEVKPDSFADEVGLQHGDVILSINHKRVASVDELSRLESQLKSGTDVLFLLARRTPGGFATLFLADRLP